MADDYDDDAHLALAIANSIRDSYPHHAHSEQLNNNDAFDDDEVNHSDHHQDDNIDLSHTIEESYRQAKRHRQERHDAELASDLAAVASLAESELHNERERLAATDAELASDIAVIDRLVEMEMNENQRIALKELSDTFSARRGLERMEGSWDCPSCTYHNRPYAARCGACDEMPPHSVLSFSGLPSSNMCFGIELELIVSGGKHDGMTCQWIAEQLSALGVPTTYSGYNHDTCREWKVVTDSSLISSSNDLCFELVSPILMGEDGLDTVRVMLESIRRIGININSSCGFHVHVDATSGSMSSLSGLKRLVHCFVSLEGAFDCLVARDASQHAQNRRANRHRYCGSNVLAFGPLSNKQRWNRIQDARSINELVNMINPNCDRYRKLNLTNLIRSDRPSTCEFRQHGGVSELLVAEAWIRLVLCFCDVTTKDSSVSSVCLLRQDAPLKEELETLLRVVNCPGIEYFYLLERNLFPLMEDRSQRAHRKKEWKCRCGRRFKDSRALSQHIGDTGHEPM